MAKPVRVTTENVLEMLLNAAPEAVAVLREAMYDETIKYELRLDCAKEILNRAYGKIRESPGGEGGRIEVVFKGEAADFAR